MQESSYQRKVVLISIWFRMVLTQTITWVYKDSLTLTHTHQLSKKLTGITLLIPVGSLMLLLTLIVDSHAFTYIPDQHWC